MGTVAFVTNLVVIFLGSKDQKGESRLFRDAKTLLIEQSSLTLLALLVAPIGWNYGL